MSDCWYLIHYESVDGGRIQRPRHVLGITGIDGFASLGLSAVEVGQTRALVRVYGDTDALDVLRATPGVTELPYAAVGGVEQIYQQRTGRSRTREQIEERIVVGSKRPGTAGSYEDDFDRPNEDLVDSPNWSSQAMVTGSSADAVKVVAARADTTGFDTDNDVLYVWDGGAVEPGVVQHADVVHDADSFYSTDMTGYSRLGGAVVSVPDTGRGGYTAGAIFETIPRLVLWKLTSDTSSGANQLLALSSFIDLADSEHNGKLRRVERHDTTVKYILDGVEELSAEDSEWPQTLTKVGLWSGAQLVTPMWAAGPEAGNGGGNGDPGSGSGGGALVLPMVAPMTGPLTAPIV